MIDPPHLERPYRREAGVFAAMLGVALVAVLVLTVGGGSSGTRAVVSFWDGEPIEPEAASVASQGDVPSLLPVVAFRAKDPPTTEEILRAAAPLAQFAPAAAAIAERSEIAPSVAIVDVRDGAVYSYDGDRDHNLLSVAKVPILLATVEEAIREERPLTDAERRWLGWMISVSDNAATEYLWEGLGGSGPINRLFREAGLPAPQFALEARWGTMRASALEVAWLLAATVSGDLVEEETRRLALELLDQVDEQQRWGVSAHLDDDGGCECLVRLKNGWFQVEDAWWLRSAGVVYGADGRAAYALVVMTDAAQSFAGGVAAIEAIAGAIHLADRAEARLGSIAAGG